MRFRHGRLGKTKDTGSASVAAFRVADGGRPKSPNSRFSSGTLETQLLEPPDTHPETSDEASRTSQNKNPNFRTHAAGRLELSPEKLHMKRPKISNEAQGLHPGLNRKFCQKINMRHRETSG